MFVSDHVPSLLCHIPFNLSDQHSRTPSHSFNTSPNTDSISCHFRTTSFQFCHGIAGLTHSRTSSLHSLFLIIHFPFLLSSFPLPVYDRYMTNTFRRHELSNENTSRTAGSRTAGQANSGDGGWGWHDYSIIDI
jgi:hypothetical protein